MIPTNPIFLTMCLATTNAFVVVTPRATPADSVGKRQASTSVGAPLGGDVTAGGRVPVACCRGSTATVLRKSRRRVRSRYLQRGLHRVQPEHLRAARVQGVRGETLSYLQHLPSAWEQRFYSTRYVVGDRSFRAFGSVQAYLVHNLPVLV